MVIVDKTTNQHRGFGFITLKDPNKVFDVLLTQPHIINSKQIDCKIAIPKELLNTVDSSSTSNTDTTAQDISSSCNKARQPSNAQHKKKKKKQKHSKPLSKSKDHHNTSSPMCINTQYNCKSNFTVDNKDTPLHLRKMFIGGLPTDVSIDALVNYFGKFGPIEKGIIMTDKNTGRLRGFGFIIFANKNTLHTVLTMGHYHYVCGKWIECKRAQPKDQVKHTNEFTMFANEELFVYQQQYNNQLRQSTHMDNSSVNDMEMQEHMHINEQLFETYFNKCISNPLTNNNYANHSTLLDSSDGNDISKLKLYKNAHKTQLFSEENDNLYVYPLTSALNYDVCDNSNNDIIIDLQDCFGPNKDTMSSKHSNLSETFKPY